MEKVNAVAQNIVNSPSRLAAFPAKCGVEATENAAGLPDKLLSLKSG